MIKEATHKLFLLCAFLLAAAAAGAQTGANPIYVSWDGTETAAGDSWDTPTTLSAALQKATAGTEIWLKGSPSPYQPGQDNNPVYVVPEDGFTVPAGVQLYGGFAGTEASIDEREVVDGIAYRMRYRTVLSGDADRNDAVDGSNLIFPDNATRKKNATHVLTLKLATGSGSLNGGAATVVNGLTIARGHADGDDEAGGGIYVTANGGTQQVGYRIEQCFFIENYATRGGALYVDGGVTQPTGAECIVDRCGFFNNAAGSRSALTNEGGAICLDGAGCVLNTAVFNNENGGILIGSTGIPVVRVLNSTVTRNTGSGIDGNGAEVVNTVIWGNAALYSAGTESPNFQYCAYPESDGTGTNIYLSDKNNDTQGPLFNSPSLRAGFDRDYKVTATLYPLWTWVPQEGSGLIDKGTTEAYLTSTYGDLDLAGNPRVAGPQEDKAIDIGAFEYQPVLAARIRYVRTAATGTGDGSSWDNASGDLQRMIDELADNNPNDLPGEVWVAAGTYEPQAQLITGTAYSASFRMRDGISVYGGFAGTETSKASRPRGTGGMPWDFENETVLQGAVYDHENLKWNNNKWTLTSDSRHVVWFAPMPGGADGGFTRPTYLDGVTVQGGYAQGGTGLAEGFMTDRGAGIYMDGADCYLTNSVVRENYATLHGGGVYLRDGRIQGCQIYNNNADAAGGAVYVDSMGLVHRSMLANNSAANGAGVYLSHTGGEHPEYLILSTCVVSNNTVRGNGAVYCSHGGVLLQNTIVNNQCVTATDATDPDASQTGGLYVDEYALVVNNVVWNNRMGTGTTTSNVPLYARNPTDATVRFLYNAISGVNNAVWNNVRQEQTLQLEDANAGTAGDGESIGPRFTEPDDLGIRDFDLEGDFGVQPAWQGGMPAYYWQPVTGSNLWARGMPLGQLPEEVVLAPEIDLQGTLFSQKPALGAFHVTGTTIVPAPEGDRLVIYVDADCTEPAHDGSSWATAYRSLNEAVAYFAGRETDLDGVSGFEIRVLEGDLWPRYAYVNEDPKTATLDILPMKSGKPLKIVGGYYRTGDNTAGRAPLEHRSVLNGNPEGRAMDEGFYHVVTVEAGARVELDGFHIVNGYAAGTAALQYGAGVLVHGDARVTLTGCILENNSAVQGAAVYAPSAASLTLNNCVVNNNTNTDSTTSVLNGPAKGTFALNHVTIVNNKGAAPDDLGTSSFALGNTSGNSEGMDGIETTGADGGAAHFANPTNGVGATLGFDTYLGGYSEFRPLTSSAEAAALINKAPEASSGLTQDITALNDRDLGGVPDLGAYEADLPKKGRVYYVRTSGDGGSDGHDGLSWATAFATVRKAVETADQGTLLNGEKPQVWVAAGTYKQDPKSDSDNCFEILDGVNVYGAFPKSGTPGMDDRHPFISQYIYYDGTYEDSDYETILEPASTYNDVRRVLGQADRYNPFSGTTTYSYVNVGAGNGDYELSQEDKYVADENGDYIYSANGGDYIGAAPAVCDYLYWERANGYYKYFTSGTNYSGDWGEPTLSLIQVGRGYGEYILQQDWWGNTYQSSKNGDYIQFTGAGYYAVAQDIYGSEYLSQNQHYKVVQGSGTHILTTQGYNYVGKGYGNYTLVPKGGYYYVGTGKGSYIRTANNEFSFPTRWDGFTLRNGYINSAKIAYLGNAGNRNGGAGAVFFKNVTLANSVIYNNENTSGNTGTEIRGGGIYTDGGTIVNCYVLNNTLGRNNQYTAYGGGLYLYSGTVYNCVISENKALGQHTDGAGVFIENGEFFNNTIVKNSSSGTTRGNGGVCIYKDDKSLVPSQLVIYNCIVLGNTGYRGSMIGNDDIAVSNSGVIKCYNTLTSSINSVGTAPRAIEYYDSKALSSINIFVDYSAGNYRLNGTEGLNMGENIPVIDGKTIDLFDYTDMDFTDRIKDCTIDAGAYELENLENTAPDASGVFYVTQNGAGTASGNSLANAACAMKLQTVLKKAGEMAQEDNNRTYTVKIAGYDGENPFVYHANTLASANNPQSYTYVVPAGVIVKGGYNEEAPSWDNDESNPEVRDVTEYKTRLSAIKEVTSTVQEVNGYHAVTFGEWPGTEDLDKEAILDGVWLQDGAATSMAGAGNPATRGGGAIVPREAHVRNCVVTGNSAIQGGGLYVLPGGRVSGTAVLDNVATDAGGGIYVENGTDGARAYVASCTVADNEAETGGGIYMEDGAMMALNTVVWGNTAPSDKNVSGVVNQQFADDVWNSVFGTTGVSYYPFNSSFVESREMPSDYENTQLESNEELYFADGLRRLKDYSLLIKHGVRNDFQTNLVAQLGVAEYDMQGIARVQVGNGADRLDAGAFAYEGGILPTELFTRLFVSQTTNVTLPDGEDMGKYLGRSFYTSFSTLEDALGYIRAMRENEANSNKKFEILVAGGTYKPTYERDNTTADVPHDQRLYSFVVPQGVSIYGGFRGDEKYITPEDMQYGNNNKVTYIPGAADVSDRTTSLTGILARRGYSDFNGNNIYEPWELAEQTILSGRLNTSGTEQNAYHVVYSEDTQGGSVLLDGLTVMDGKTHNALSAIGENNEQGRGGGIYSHGVTYTLSRCRLLDNQAVRGGAVFVRDADLNLTGCILAGNRSVKNEATSTGDIILYNRGGAAYVAGIEKVANLRAVNTLWANNEAEGSDDSHGGEGSAIGTNYAEGITSEHDPIVDLMNNTFVRNKARINPVLYNHNGKSQLVNTLIWGNEGAYDEATDIANLFTVSHSASDVDYGGKFAAGSSDGNILLDKENMGTNGPRFANPASEAGAGGNDARNLWNPAAISVVTDAGDGTEHTEHELEGETEHTDNTTNGAYSAWLTENQSVPEAYVKEGTYERYSGPRGQNNEQLCKPIDIGVYEYQYVSNFSTMPAIYVDMVSRGTGSGNEWANATDDLRGAIVGAANPTDNYGPRTVYVRDGEYSYPRISAGSAYILDMADDKRNESLTLKGSCTGTGDQQDFSKPTVVRNAPGQSVGQLMTVATNSKPVAIEGFTFINKSGTGDRKGIDASTGNGGSLTLKNTAFRLNGTGVDAISNSGSVLIVNTLFADNTSTGFTNDGSSGAATLVNTTFANNGTDMSIADSETSVYNSVSWNRNNGTQNMPEGNNNAKIADGTENRDLHKGPNFVDPDNTDVASRDYRIRPSLTLLNKGSNVNYLKQALGDEDADENTPFPETERDLYNVPRMVDRTIDIGAYEYEAPLQPIVYVKAGLTVANPDGRSWQTALGDLQGAVDLAGIYADGNKNVGGYVFVHGNVSAKENLRVTLAGTKVYGGMNDETSSHVVYDTETGSIKVDGVKPAVAELLEKRAGLLEETTRSALSGVAVSAASVVDGFEVGGPVTLSGGGYLSTSVVGTEADPEAAAVSGDDDGILYNTLVYGSVSGVQAVNVTATGAIANVSGSANNRASVPGDSLNRYVKADHWKYQLNEDDEANIDKGTQLDLRTYIAMVGHSRDIAGNLRIRNKVDNGCFETWNVAEDMTATAEDYPHGKSVVYVRAGKELLLDNDKTAGALYKADQAFNPGFLLLEHQAGLRGNRNYVGLTHFAVERDLGGDGTDLAAMPFETVDNDMLYNIVDAQGVTVKTYNGKTRSAYDYQFDSADSKAWDSVAVADILGKPAYTGFALEGAENTKVRFYGESYTETPEDKVVTLKQWNYREPWSSPDDGGNRFTHKENMGWNLFGSPYLCAMNYTDMEYGRVLYGLNNEGNGYTTVLTYDEKTGESNKEGYIPAGDAVFTQTATLQDKETFAVGHSASKATTPYATKALSLYLASASTGAVKRSATTAAGDDRLLLNAVPTERALPDFDLGIDGVKWMAADGKPQIFAVRGAGRYSLLGALDVESTTTVGVTTAGAGFYEIGIPDDCPAEGYETVRLRDRKTGAEADLLQEPYVFSAVAGEDCTERFEVSFRAVADELLPSAGMTASVDETGLLRVGNLPEGTTRVTLYDAEGRAVAAAGCAGCPEAEFRLTAHGVYVVQADGGARVKIVW